MSRQGGLAFIKKQQLPDGGFFAYDTVRPSKRYRTTFVPSLIALALHDVPGSQLLGSQIADFLLTQKNSDWSWNYWDRQSVHARKIPTLTTSMIRFWHSRIYGSMTRLFLRRR